MEQIDYLSSDEENDDFELSICNSLIQNLSPGVNRQFRDLDDLQGQQQPMLSRSSKHFDKQSLLPPIGQDKTMHHDRDLPDVIHNYIAATNQRNSACDANVSLNYTQTTINQSSVMPGSVISSKHSKMAFTQQNHQNFRDEAAKDIAVIRGHGKVKNGNSSIIPLQLIMAQSSSASGQHSTQRSAQRSSQRSAGAPKQPRQTTAGAGGGLLNAMKAPKSVGASGHASGHHGNPCSKSAKNLTSAFGGARMKPPVSESGEAGTMSGMASSTARLEHLEKQMVHQQKIQNQERHDVFSDIIKIRKKEQQSKFMPYKVSAQQSLQAYYNNAYQSKAISSTSQPQPGNDRENKSTADPLLYNKFVTKNRDLGPMKLPKNPYNTKNSNLLIKSACQIYSSKRGSKSQIRSQTPQNASSNPFEQSLFLLKFAKLNGDLGTKAVAGTEPYNLNTVVLSKEDNGKNHLSSLKTGEKQNSSSEPKLKGKTSNTPHALSENPTAASQRQSIRNLSRSRRESQEACEQNAKKPLSQGQDKSGNNLTQKQKILQRLQKSYSNKRITVQDKMDNGQTARNNNKALLLKLKTTKSQSALKLSESDKNATVNGQNSKGTVKEIKEIQQKCCKLLEKGVLVSSQVAETDEKAAVEGIQQSSRRAKAKKLSSIQSTESIKGEKNDNIRIKQHKSNESKTNKAQEMNIESMKAKNENNSLRVTPGEAHTSTAKVGTGPKDRAVQNQFLSKVKIEKDQKPPNQPEEQTECKLLLKTNLKKISTANQNDQVIRRLNKPSFRSDKTQKGQNEKNEIQKIEKIAPSKISFTKTQNFDKLPSEDKWLKQKLNILDPIKSLPKVQMESEKQNESKQENQDAQQTKPKEINDKRETIGQKNEEHLKYSEENKSDLMDFLNNRDQLRCIELQKLKIQNTRNEQTQMLEKKGDFAEQTEKTFLNGEENEFSNQKALENFKNQFDNLQKQLQKCLEAEQMVRYNNKDTNGDPAAAEEQQIQQQALSHRQIKQKDDELNMMQGQPENLQRGFKIKKLNSKIELQTQIHKVQINNEQKNEGNPDEQNSLTKLDSDCDFDQYHLNSSKLTSNRQRLFKDEPSLPVDL